MTLNEIKKYLYKEKPIAHFMYVRSGSIYYNTPYEEGKGFYFRVPVADIGEATFLPEMPSQQLIRYLILTNRSSDEPTWDPTDKSYVDWINAG